MDKDQILFVGTYTQKMLHNETTNSQGIYSLGFNSSEGTLSPRSSIIRHYCQEAGNDQIIPRQDQNA